MSCSVIFSFSVTDITKKRSFALCVEKIAQKKRVRPHGSFLLGHYLSTTNYLYIQAAQTEIKSTRAL